MIWLLWVLLVILLTGVVLGSRMLMRADRRAVRTRWWVRALLQVLILSMAFLVGQILSRIVGLM